MPNGAPCLVQVGVRVSCMSDTSVKWLTLYHTKFAAVDIQANRQTY